MDAIYIRIMMQEDNLSPQSAAALLRFYAEAGVVDLIEDAPIDRFAQTKEQIASRASKKQTSTPQAQKAPFSGAPSATSRPSPTQPSSMPPQSASIAVPDQATMDEARELAKSAKDLNELKKLLGDFKGCNLRQGAKNTVFSDGNPEAPIMLVGEAPGRDEDLQGVPFVGRAGQLLDKMLAAINLDRKTCYITNIIPWRPPGNRTPVPHEIELCRPFVERHIELVAPKLLVFMGNVSNKTLLNTSKGILSMRGTWSQYQVGENQVPVMSTLHPAYLLRTPAAKRNSWADLLAIKAKLDEIIGN